MGQLQKSMLLTGRRRGRKDRWPQYGNDWVALRLGLRTKAEVSDVIAWSDPQIGPDCTG